MTQKGSFGGRLQVVLSYGRMDMSDLMIGLAEWERGYRAGRRSLHRPGPVATHGETRTWKAA